MWREHRVWNTLPWDRWWWKQPRERRARLALWVVGISFVAGAVLYRLGYH